MRNEIKLLSVLAISAVLLTIVPASAPAITPRVAPKVAALGLTGKLFYHRYTEYGDWASKGFELDLATGRLVRIDTAWTSAKSPLNFHPNADGTALTFMGTQTGLVESEWDVFVTHWDGTKWADPINLTGPNDKRDEDPKFSPNGHTITYKENGVLATIEIDGTEKQYLTVGKPESSMPYFTSDGLSLIFEREGSIWKRTSDGTESKLWKKKLTSAYYPINVDSNRFLFTEVQATRHDRLMMGYYNGDAPKPFKFMWNYCDNSDPYPYKAAKRFVFLVSGCPIPWKGVYKGGYNLMVIDRETKTVYNMDAFNTKVNSHRLELGPAWSATAPIPE
ncbi:MAG: hypothetical protein RLZZ330_20 [Actinomycetota bacterium]|jgi:hypothetical protein